MTIDTEVGVFVKVGGAHVDNRVRRFMFRAVFTAFLAALCSAFGVPLRDVVFGAVAPPGDRFVFAHYCVAANDYNIGVVGYERDIQEAQSAGIDGFALNCGEWGAPGSNEGNYQLFVSQMFQAAAALNTGFKLFFSIDGAVPAAEIIDMMSSYAANPCYFRYEQKAVLSTYGGAEVVDPAGNKKFWLGQVIEPLKNMGVPLFFCPMIYPLNPPLLNGETHWTVSGAPGPSQADAGYAQIKDFVDGYFWSGIGYADTPEHARSSLAASDEFAELLHSDGKIFMSSVTPSYFFDKTSNARTYVEYAGGAGIGAQWHDIMNVQAADWVELFTWNDYDEDTYFSPNPNPALSTPGAVQFGNSGYYPSHAGALALTAYYIKWFKSGRQPAPPAGVDNIYYFYRRHPAQGNPLTDALGPIVPEGSDIADQIEVTTILTAPAVLKVNSGSDSHSYSLAAGLTNTNIPFETGPQTFELWRGGACLIEKSGPDVTPAGQICDLHMYSGSASD